MLTACSAPSKASAPLAKVSAQLGWIHEYSSAEYYTAQKNGRFAAQNLEVDLHEGGYIDGKYVDGIEEVTAGKIDFGETSDIRLLQARAEGKPIVAVAAVVQRNPIAIISLAKSNIHRPQDLVGHKVAVSDGGDSLMLHALLTTQKIDPSQLTIVPRTTFGIDPLVNGEVDAFVGWIINEGVQVKQAGYEPSFILMSDYGIESYNAVLFTTEDMIKNKPDVVQRYVAALVQGIDDVISNPAQAIDYTLQYGKDLKRDDQMARLQTMLPLLKPSGTKSGMMSDATWNATYQMLLDNKLIDKSVDVKAAYTLRFLNEIYK